MSAWTLSPGLQFHTSAASLIERRIEMGKHWIQFLVLFLLFIPVNGTFASSKTIPATGKFVMGDLDSKSDAKKIALLNAKQMALEAAGTYLSSLTQVQNFELTGDEVSSLSAGVIAIEIIDEEWTMEGESPVVTITIRATIDPTGLEDQIKAVQEDKETVEEYKQIQGQLAALKEELTELKSREKEAPASAEEKPARREAGYRKTKETIDRLLSLEAVRKASSFQYRGKSDVALAGLDGAISLDPGNFHAYLKRAQVHEMRKAYPQAIGDVNAALKINPKSANAYALRGRLQTKKGERRRALLSFARAIELDNRCGVCYLGRGIAYMQMRKLQKAYSDFDIACRRGVKDGGKKARQLRQLKEKGAKQGKRRPARRPARE